MNVTSPRPVLRQPWFWITALVVSAIFSALAWRLFPIAFPLLSLDIRMDRAGAARAARALATIYKWGPANAPRDVASFGGDGYAQAFVELEGGGAAAWRALLGDGFYSPYSWRVRLFQEGETNQTTVRFRPDGTPYGFAETLRQRAEGAKLDADAARAIAERTARGAPWRLDLAQFKPAEASQVTRPGGRIDHTFVYERTGRVLGEGRLRLRLVVGGDRLTELSHFVKVPEAFDRRYSQMRSKNDTIANVASGAMGVLYGAGGVGVGLFFLLRRRALLARPALACAGVFAGLQLLASLNAWPLAWLGYDTALSGAGFITERQVSLVLGAIGVGGLFFLFFLAAEGLTRLAFPEHPQFWRLWSAGAGASAPVLGRTVAGYLVATLHLLYVLVFYYAARRWLGWWTPTDTLADPDSLAHLWPWLTPLAGAAQAGFMEEVVFRAIPLAGAALLGARFGGRRWWIAAAMLLQAIVFAAAHANYPGQPAYSRVVELIVPSLIFGGLYLRFGLLPAIVSHFAYDAVLMALPLFASSAAGIWFDRGAVVLLALLPLWVVLWWRARKGAVAELPAGLRNRDWEAPPAPPPAPSRAPWSLVAGTVSPWLWRAMLAAAMVGAAIWVATAKVTPLAPPLTVNRGEAEQIARTAVAKRGWKLPAQARALATVSGRAGDIDRFAWEKAGPPGYAALLGTYVPLPRWYVRFVVFSGDVVERAEEWICWVGADGTPGRMRHQLPEGRAGATLTKEEARDRAHAALRERFSLDPAALKEVSATSAKRPKRMDWTFVFKDPKITTLGQGEARISVVIAGDEVVDGYRFIFVPEEWERAQRARGGPFRIGRMVGTTLGAILLLAGVGAGVVAWSRGRSALRPALILAAVVAGCSLAAIANSWPATVARFSTIQAYELQRVMALAGPIVGNLVMAAALALVIGLTGRWLRAPLADTRRAAGFGCTAGWIAVGVFGIATLVRGDTGPSWPGFGSLERFVPWLGALPGAVEGYVLSTAMLLLLFGAVDRWTACWTRQRALVSGLLVAAVATISLGGDAANLGRWIGAALLVGVAVLVVYVLALRQDLTVLPLATGVLKVADVVGSCLQRQHPAAVPGAIIAALGITALAWWWFRTLRELAARPTASGEAVPPPVPPAPPPPAVATS